MITMPSTLHWQVGGRLLDLTQGGRIMGILNVTPDSFYDGGRHREVERAVAHGLEMVKAGAAIIDVGGESTRPGAEPVPEKEELERVIPVLERLRAETDVLLSIDTMKANVAAAALQAGAEIVNDVSALRADPRMVQVLQDSDAGVILMHMQGEPRTMQAAPAYEDVVREVRDFLAERLGFCEEAGIACERVVIDPGIGFGKRYEHNLTLLREIEEFECIGRPLLIGASRKSFLGTMLGGADFDQRLWPTVALTALLRRKGIRLFRVHDVRENRDALRMTEALLGEEPA